MGTLGISAQYKYKYVNHLKVEKEFSKPVSDSVKEQSDVKIAHTDVPSQGITVLANVVSGPSLKPYR